MRNQVLVGAIAGLALSSAANAQWVTFDTATETNLQLVTVTMNDNAEKDVFAADFDKDGWTDVIVVRKLAFSNPGKRQDVLFMNEGGVLVDRTNEYAPGFIENFTDSRDVTAHDMNGDDWLDLVIGTTFDDPPRLYINLGEDKRGNWLGFADESFRIADIGVNAKPFKMCSVSADDVNMDGFPDIYMTNYEGGDDLLMINDGTGMFTDETVERLGNLANVAFGTKNQIRDMDKDGDNDLIKVSTLFGAAPFNIGVYILWNDGDGYFNEYEPIPNTSSPYMIDISDLDNDADYDIYVVQDPQDSYHHSTVNGPNNLSWQSFSPNPSPRTTGFGGNADHVDIDNDGDLDAMVTPVDVDIANCNDGRYALLRNDGAGKLSDPWQGNQPWHTYAHDAVQFDINNDGCDDIFQGLCGGNNPGWGVFIQTNGNCEPDCVADFNGDGDLNILDFVAFQNAFTAGDESADVNDDGALNILDFVAFQNIFQAGC
jgi:hypothetical protein